MHREVVHIQRMICTRTENGNREQRLRDEKWLEMEVEVEAVTESACHISAFSS